MIGTFIVENEQEFTEAQLRDYAKIRKVTGVSYDKNTSTWIL